MMYRLSPYFKVQTDFTLPQKKDAQLISVQSTLNNSATRTSLAMILDAYESPSHRLSHAVPLVSRFKVKYVPVQIFPPFMKTSKLPVHSTLYNSATRTSLAMILDSYESPTSGLSYAVPYVRRLGKKYISVQFFPTGPIFSTPRVFGLWRMYFPPVLVRTDRRLLV